MPALANFPEEPRNNPPARWQRGRITAYITAKLEGRAPECWLLSPHQKV